MKRTSPDVRRGSNENEKSPLYPPLKKGGRGDLQVKNGRLKDKLINWGLKIILLLLAILFIIKFAGVSLLKLYVKQGIGDCEKIPILCIAPEESVIHPADKEFIDGLLPYKFPEMAILMPKGFTVVKERVKKVYYKKMKHRDRGSICYLLYEPPDFFVKLFPELSKHNVKNDYEFLSRIMHSTIEDIKTVPDAFFVITKGIFIPDLGDQKNVKMIEFHQGNKKGFINYSISPAGNFFDCNVFNQAGDFFKIYIKDKERLLDLSKIAVIISMLQRAD